MAQAFWGAASFECAPIYYEERPGGHRTPSQRRLDRLAAYYDRLAHERVLAEYEANHRDGEGFGSWAMAEINRRQSAYLDKVFAEPRKSDGPNIIIRRST